MHPAQPTSTQLQPSPPSSFQPPFTWASTQLSATPSTLLEPSNLRYRTYRVISPDLGPKIQSCLSWLKIGPWGNLDVLIPNPDLVFWNSDPKIHFWANLGQKSQSYQFCLKIGTHGIWRMLILILSIVFWISYPKFIFGQIWTENVKAVSFAWKLAHTASRGCWFLFWY